MALARKGVTVYGVDAWSAVPATRRWRPPRSEDFVDLFTDQAFYARMCLAMMPPRAIRTTTGASATTRWTWSR